MFALKRLTRLIPRNLQLLQMAKLNEWGSGGGKGGNGGGAIRDAGGSFGRMEAAREEDFIKRKQKEQLKILKNRADKKPETPLVEAQIKK